MEIIEPTPPPESCPTCKVFRDKEKAVYEEMNHLFPIPGDGSLPAQHPLAKQRYDFLKQALPDGCYEENCPTCGKDVPAGFNDDDEDDEDDDDDDDDDTCEVCGEEPHECECTDEELEEGRAVW